MGAALFGGYREGRVLDEPMKVPTLNPPPLFEVHLGERGKLVAGQPVQLEVAWSTLELDLIIPRRHLDRLIGELAGDLL